RTWNLRKRSREPDKRSTPRHPKSRNSRIKNYSNNTLPRSARPHKWPLLTITIRPQSEPGGEAEGHFDRDNRKHRGTYRGPRSSDHNPRPLPSLRRTGHQRHARPKLRSVLPHWHNRRGPGLHLRPQGSNNIRARITLPSASKFISNIHRQPG